MFTKKKDHLFETAIAGNGNGNGNNFIATALKESSQTLSGNGALKYDSTGDVFLDQFSNLSNYRQPRSFTDIARDCEDLWLENKTDCVKFILYIRMVSRKTLLPLLNKKTEESQIGAGLKHEGIMRMIWLSQKDSEIFWSNIGLFISCGCIKDIFTMLKYDLVYHGWEDRVLDWHRFGNLIKTLLGNENTVELVKKYLPQIRSRNKCFTVEQQANTIVAKWVCSLLFGTKNNSSTYKRYRKLKTSGTAHEWQQLISQQKFDKIDFNKIHGRALNLLVKSKFLHNHGLSDKYANWVSQKDNVKYTGYVHELLCELSNNSEDNFVQTVNKQFKEMVDKTRNNDGVTPMIVVRDTSASMRSCASGTKYMAFDIAKSIAIFFSEFLTGQFANSFIEFSHEAKLHNWKGSTPSEKFLRDSCDCIGNTNFQSVIDLFCKLASQGVSEKDFPRGIICISDGEFDPSELNETNVQGAKRKLLQYFSQEYVDNFKIVLWNVSNAYYGNSKVKFETFGHSENVFYMSGYSAEQVNFLTSGEIKTARDLLDKALDQELLNFVNI